MTNVKTSGTYTGSGFATPTGTNAQYLMADGSISTGTGAITMGAIGTATANGASITSGVLSLAPADATNPGIVTTTAQTIAGAKTFSADLAVNGAVNTSGALTGGNTATSTIAGFAANMNPQTGTTYRLSTSDNGKIITLNNATAIILTVPTLFAGFNCMIVQLGVGQVTIAADGVTVSNRNSFTKTSGTNAMATILAISSTAFISGGDMTN